MIGLSDKPCISMELLSSFRHEFFRKRNTTENNLPLPLESVENIILLVHYGRFFVFCLVLFCLFVCFLFCFVFVFRCMTTQIYFIRNYIIGYLKMQ